MMDSEDERLLRMLPFFESVLPDEFIQHHLSRSGVGPENTEFTRLLAFVMEKFLVDTVLSAKHHTMVRGGTTKLSVDDAKRALREQGNDFSRMEYIADSTSTMAPIPLKLKIRPF